MGNIHNHGNDKNNPKVRWQPVKADQKYKQAKIVYKDVD